MHLADGTELNTKQVPDITKTLHVPMSTTKLLGPCMGSGADASV